MENQRRWEDLNKDCLANVFERVGVESLLLNVPFVCNSWHKASLNPSCWQCLIFPDNDTSPDGFDLQAQDFQSRDKLPTDVFGTFMNKFQNKYQIDGNRFSLNAFLKFVINRSRGRATFLRLPADCTHEALEYVANVCPSLEALSLPRYLVHQVRSTLPGLIEKWKHLELLSLGSSVDLVKTLSEISIHCKNFRRLHVSYSYIGNDEALHIVKLVPNIKHLSLRKAYIEQENLVTLIVAEGICHVLYSC